MLIVAALNWSNPNSPETFGVQYFNGHDHQHLGGIALASNGTDWVLPIGERKVSFIDFNLALE
jgi:hypothetical protein